MAHGQSAWSIWAPEIAGCVWMLLWAVFYFVLTKILRNRASTIEQKDLEKKPSLLYLGYRFKAYKFLNNKNVDDAITFFGRMFTTTRVLIAAQLDEQDFKEAQEDLDNMMEHLYENLFGAIESEQKKKLMMKAVRFTLKTMSMKDPSDILGQRRAYTIEMALDKVWSQKRRKSGTSTCLSSLARKATSLFHHMKEKLSSSEEPKPGPPPKYRITSILLNIAKMILLTILPFAFDFYTDGDVTFQFLRLSKRFGNFSILGLARQEVGGGTNEVSFPAIILVFVFGLSLVINVVSNPAKMLARQLKVKLQLSSGKVERSQMTLPTSQAEHDEELF